MERSTVPARARVKTLVVGEAPSRESEGRAPLDGRSGQRLARLAGVERLEDRYDVANLLGLPGPSGKGSRFPRDEVGALRARRLLRGRRRVIVLGRRAAAVLGLGRAEYLAWQRLEGARVAVFPHPSGVNHWWNDPANVELAREFLRRERRMRS